MVLKVLFTFFCEFIYFPFLSKILHLPTNVLGVAAFNKKIISGLNMFDLGKPAWCIVVSSKRSYLWG